MNRNKGMQMKQDRRESVDTDSQSIRLFGEISWLWVNSPLHQEWPVALLGINIIPPIHHQQFMLLRQKEMPVAYCSWALFDLAAEKKYLADVNSLQLPDWASGDRMWLIDWIAPFGHSFSLYKEMRARFPNKIARAMRVDANEKNARIQEIRGKGVSRGVAHEKFNGYFRDIVGDYSAI